MRIVTPTAATTSDSIWQEFVIQDVSATRKHSLVPVLKELHSEMGPEGSLAAARVVPGGLPDEGTDIFTHRKRMRDEVGSELRP